MAPLEFVLVYPTFLALLCCSMWIAGMMLRKSQLTVGVRYSGDAKRQGGTAGSSSKPFEFRSKSDGRIAAADSTQFRFSGFMPTGKVSASYSVLVGTWDHQQLPMDVVPDYPLILRLTGQGPLDSINDKLQEAMAFLQDIGSLLEPVQDLLESDSLEDFVGNLGDVLGSLASSNLGGDNADLLSNGGGADVDKLLSGQSKELSESQKPVEEILDVVRKLTGSSSDAVQDQKAQAAQEREQVQQRAQEAKAVAQTFADTDGDLQKLRQTLDSKEVSVEDKQKAAAETIDGLRQKFGDARSRLIPNPNAAKVVDGVIQKSADKLTPAQRADLPGLQDRMRKSGLAGLEQQLDVIETNLDAAIKAKDAAKIEKLQKSLATLMDVTESRLKDVGTTLDKIAEASRGGESNADRLKPKQ